MALVFKGYNCFSVITSRAGIIGIFYWCLNRMERFFQWTTITLELICFYSCFLFLFLFCYVASLEYFRLLKDLVWLYWHVFQSPSDVPVMCHIFVERTFCTAFTLHRTLLFSSTVTVSCFLFFSWSQLFIVSFDNFLEVWCTTVSNLDSITVKYFM